MALYGMFSFLDYAIYKMVSFVVKLIVIIANTDFFKPAVIENVASRVYVALGVVVLFKVIITCVQYMVNPDVFDDKEKGMAGILKKTVICMVLLVVVRPAFSLALEMQSIVVGTIPGLVLENGTNYKFTNDTADDLKNIGNQVAGTTIWAFVTPKEDKCKNNGKISDNEITINCETGATYIKNKNVDGTVDGFIQSITRGCDGSIWALFDTSKCYFDYRIMISTAAGVFLLYVLASMALDVGIRTIKLGILQILAPIPIGSYIVSKDKLNKFIKLSAKVYADLFIRLGIVYFIIFFVQKVIDSIRNDLVVAGGAYKPDGLEISFIKVIIVVALFMFAKNAPKFICDVLGIDGGGADDIKGMFTRAGGFLGTTLGSVRAARSNYTTQKERYDSKGKKKAVQIAAGLGSAAAGLGSGLARGMYKSAIQGKGFSESRQGAFKDAISARDRRIDRYDNLYNTDVPKYIQKVDENGKEVFKDGKPVMVRNPKYYSRFDARKDVRREKLGIPTDTAFVKARYDTMSNIAKDAASAKSHGDGKREETPDRYDIGLKYINSKGEVEYMDADARMIYDTLGFESMSMEHARNLYALAKNGTEVEDLNGKKIKLNSDQMNALGNVVQKIEKRTSYMKEAELMGTGDPTAVPNAEKLRIQVENNKTMFNNADIMNVISSRLSKLGINVSNADELLSEIDALKTPMTDSRPSKPIKPEILLKGPPKAPKMPEKPDEPVKPVAPVAPANDAPQYEHFMYAQKRVAYDEAIKKYNEDHLAYEKAVATYNTQYNDWVIANDNYKVELDRYNIDAKPAQDKFDKEMDEYNTNYSKWIKAVSDRADILSGIKDAFEYVAKVEFAPAQAADVRNQKAQQAVGNSKDNKS